MNPLLAAVLQPGRETLLVMEDMGLYVAYALRGKDGVFPLDDYRQNRHLPDVPSLFRDEVIGRRLAGRLSSARYVAYANADFGYKLARAYPEASRSLSVRFPRDIHLRDLKASNLILLGGTVVNPWVGLYEDGLNFAMRYFEPGGGFANRLPLGAEPGVFGGWSASERLYFARIALIPNLQEGSRVLILTGMGTAVTETAADFVLDPGAGNRLPAEVVQALAQPGNHVEILLKCAPVLDAPYRSEVAAWRVKRQ